MGKAMLNETKSRQEVEASRDRISAERLGFMADLILESLPAGGGSYDPLRERVTICDGAAFTELFKSGGVWVVTKSVMDEDGKRPAAAESLPGEVFPSFLDAAAAALAFVRQWSSWQN